MRLSALLGASAALCIVISGCAETRSSQLAAPTQGDGLAPTPTAASAGHDRPERSQQQRPWSFTLCAVGDVMLDRGVWRRIQANGSSSILAQVRDDLRAADVCFANLECPLSTVGAHAPMDCIFRADPRAAEVLVDGGIDVVALANNHSLDAGVSGLLQTIDHLEDAGIAYCGAAREKERAWEPARFLVEDRYLGFIACTDLSFGHGSWCKVDDGLTGFAERVRTARELCDLLVVSIHWGNEYQKEPTQRQRDVALAAVEAGANLVIGHHPHTLQGVAQHQGAPILYSCGNFVFDQREGERMESAIFHLRYTKGEGWQIRMVPVWIPRSRCGPIYPETSRAAKIIDRLATLSTNLGVPVTVRGAEGFASIAAPEAAGGTSSQERDDQAVAAAWTG